MAKPPSRAVGVCGFESRPRYPLVRARRGTQTGKAAWLKPRCVRVRSPPSASPPPSPRRAGHREPPPRPSGAAAGHWETPEAPQAPIRSCGLRTTAGGIAGRDLDHPGAICTTNAEVGGAPSSNTARAPAEGLLAGSGRATASVSARYRTGGPGVRGQRGLARRGLGVVGTGAYDLLTGLRAAQ